MQVLDVLFLTSTINQYIIEVYHHILTDEGLKNVIHKPLVKPKEL